MTQPEQYQAIIIGAGQAGGPLAGALARAGWRVALIERVHVGGTCVNEGCTPTKTMVASARVAHLARRAADYGVRGVGQVTVDLAQVRERKRAVVESFRRGSESGVRSSGAELIMGEAQFTGPKSVRVQLRDGGTRDLVAERIFINVGARPSRPDLPGLHGVGALDSTSILELDTLPEHLIILGGGHIGLEFAQMFARFGSRVTLIERGARLMPREDEDVAGALQDVLAGEGVAFKLGAQATAARRGADGQIELDLEGGETLRGDQLLVGAGRTPNSDTLHLEAAGIEMDDRGHITVNGQLETNVPGVYALGDVKGGPAFTHVSYDDYRIVRDQVLGGTSRSTDDRHLAAHAVPYTVFTDPQLARVGLSAQAAREAGQRVRVYTLPMTRAARAIETGETAGLMRAVVDDTSDRLLGATVLAVDGGEVLGVLQMAMQGGLSASHLREAVFAHPTLSESINNLFMGTPELIEGKQEAAS